MAYVLEILEGTTYLIKIDGALDGQKFTIEEKDYDLGEGRTNPIIVDGDTYTFGDEVPSNLWLQYTMKKDGVLTIESDKPYNTMAMTKFITARARTVNLLQYQDHTSTEQQLLLFTMLIFRLQQATYSL